VVLLLHPRCQTTWSFCSGSEEEEEEKEKEEEEEEEEEEEKEKGVRLVTYTTVGRAQ
jgi:hypothetical protein